MNSLNKLLLNDGNVKAGIIKFYTKIGEKQKVIDFIDNNNNNNNTNSVICAMLEFYAKYGDIDNLLTLFDDNKNNNDYRMHCIVINGLSHFGLIDKAINIFYSIPNNKLSSIITNTMIDCLARNNYLNKAENLYNKTYGNNNNFDKKKYHALHSILSSCRIYNDILRAKRIFNEIISDSNNVNDLYSSYLLLSNIYAQNNNFDKVRQIDDEMKVKGIKIKN